MAGIAIAARVEAEVESVRLALYRGGDIVSTPQWSPAHVPASGRVRIRVGGLPANRFYRCALEIDGEIDYATIGSFTTAPDGPASFKFGLASCAANSSNHAIFDRIREHEGLRFFVHLGDMHYADIDADDETLYHTALDGVFAQPRQSALWRSMPTMYMWDDHDYGPNNSDGTATGRDAAVRAYRARVPHAHRLVEEGAEAAVHYRFEWGRVVFLVTDLRSERTPNGATDDSSKTTMGAAQKAWFIAQLSAAENEGRLLVWVNTVPWTGDTTPDGWGSFTTERAEIANAIKAAGVAERFCIVSGDIHSISIDDGSNSDYADGGGGAAIPVFVAAPLHGANSTQGGPWSEGSYSGSQNQVGVMDVTDSGGDTIGVKWVGYRAPTGEEVGLQELVTYEWTAQV